MRVAVVPEDRSEMSDVSSGKAKRVQLAELRISWYPGQSGL